MKNQFNSKSEIRTNAIIAVIMHICMLVISSLDSKYSLCRKCSYRTRT